MIAPRLLATVTGLALVAACSPDTPENEIAAGNALDAAEGGSAESVGGEWGVGFLFAALVRLGGMGRACR